ncbi:hypothetical protein HFK74_28590|uniref:hypothetical protein n=1 Tax=Pseudomonas sp. SbOxS1 TaxID=2723884 RepID=UPI0015D12683|nr:hypothetical protein [Pseudomonas sp. SbOxS1]NYU06665.1 hypothetical protein [Pseudomonas sp. SbOxS1]
MSNILASDSDLNTLKADTQNVLLANNTEKQSVIAKIEHWLTTTSPNYEDLKLASLTFSTTPNSSLTRKLGISESNVEQWLAFYGHPTPSSSKQLKYLARFLKLEFPKTPATANYGELLANPEHSPNALTTQQRNEIKNITRQFGQMNGKLINHLRKSTLDAVAVTELRASPHNQIIHMTNSSISRIWANGYLQALGWYGTTPGQSPFQGDLQQLLMSAMLLDIHPNTGLDTHKGQVLGYELYNPRNAERAASQILLDVENHLVEKNYIDARTAPLVAHIYLATAAPEFLVRNLPQTLTIGSPGWVTLTFTVAKLEAIAAGSSRLMTYEQVIAYADIEPFTEELEQLFGIAVMEPLLNWGAMNGVIPYDISGEYSLDDYTAANARYVEYTDALQQCSDALSTPLPMRQEVAMSELERVMPNTVCLTEKSYLHYALGYDDDKKLSICDMFMSGALLSEGWKGEGIAPQILFTRNNDQLNTNQTVASLRNLQNPSELYNKCFDEYFKQLNIGFFSTLKLAISKAEPIDRAALTFGFVEFYTIRKQALTTKETQIFRDKHRGRFGVLIRAEHKGKSYYFELFTLRAELIRRTDSELDNTWCSTYFEYPRPTSDKNEKQWTTKHREWPIDLDAYLNGSEPVKGAKSMVVVEKVWELPANSRGDQAPLGQLNTFYFQRTAVIVEKVLEYCPPATREELYPVGFGMTAVEAALKNSAENIEIFLNLMIPFKSCIEDLTSGDPDRESSGVVGCALDGLAMVSAVAGAVPKLASIALKSTSLLSKSLKLVRFSATFALSLVNPLDGVPSLIKKGAKITKGGALLLTRQGYKSCSKASGQLRTLSGTLDTLNAAKSLKCPGVIPARLQEIGDLSSATEMLIFKRGVDWYALEVDSLEPRGPKVVNFQTAEA